jgi:hypothetical protein
MALQYSAARADSGGPGPSSTAKASAAFVLGISSVLAGWVPFLCFLALVAAVLALVFGTLSLRDDRRNRRAGSPQARGHGLALAGVILAPFGLIASGIGIWLSVVSIREVNEYTNVGDYSVVETGCTVTNGVARSDGTITNESSTARSYTIVVQFLRPGTDNSLYTDNAVAADVQPGERATWSVMSVVREETLECRVDDVTGPLPFGQD